jgi:hypothetical protein
VRGRWAWLLVLVAWLAPASAADRTIPVTGQLLLRLQPFKMVVVVLPEPPSSVTSPLSPKALQIGEDGVYLTLVPLSPDIPPGDLAIVGDSGKLYMLGYHLVTERPDRVVTLAKPVPPKGTPLTTAGMLRALRTGIKIPGSTAREAILPALPDPRVALQGATSLALGKTITLTATLVNTQEAPLALDIRVGEPLAPAPDPFTVYLEQWIWPPKWTVRAVAVDQDVLPPHGQTTLYVIGDER